MKKNIGTTYLELLSPAKDLASGKLAILSGADAVYIGGPGFSARSAAGNSWEDIEALCTFAHQFYAKVFVTVNTIFYDGEEERVRDTLSKAYQSGADALIIQDMGILKLDPPPIPLIASTQCHNYDPEHIAFLRDAGFSRVILARELSIEQISNIHEKVPDIDLEAFVHGALCVSYSGRCYISQYLTGRSANRGNCMQACRLPFDLTDSTENILEKNKYLLSTKDLCMSGHLQELVEAGVTSFKIEGRLKDAAYAGNVTSAYSKELNSIVAGSNGIYSRSSSGISEVGYEPDLSKSFNRGFTKYFYYGRKGTVIAETGQKSLGEFIGKVKDMKKGYFTLNAEHDLKNGDGICWTGSDGELDGVNINSVDGEKIFPYRKFPQKEGTDIYRNEDPSFERMVLNTAERRIGMTLEISLSGGNFVIKAADEDGNHVAMIVPFDAEEAKDADNSEANWRKQFSKTGGSIFCLKSININSVTKYFVPVSILNKWRRLTIDALFKERLKNYPREIAEHTKRTAVYTVKKIDRSYNVANRFSEEFYKKSGAELVEKAYEVSDKEDIRVLMTTKHCLKYHLKACTKLGGPLKLNEPLYLMLNGKKYMLEFDCAGCEMKVKQ